MNRETIAIRGLIFGILIYSLSQGQLLWGIIASAMVFIAIKQITTAQQNFSNFWYTPEQRVTENENISDGSIYALFVKLNLTRRPRPEADDALGKKLFIVQGFLEIVFIISFIAWKIYSYNIGTEINVIGYLFLSIFISLVLVSSIFYFHIKNYKLLVFFILVVSFFFYTFFGDLILNIAAWSWF
ncbi:MAG: hypothetical protein SVM80_09550 [Halobacteriota archaeon]|nr:hypothetical protein [Halobacteriota archaeon]